MLKPPSSGYILRTRVLGLDLFFHWTFPFVGFFAGVIIRNLVKGSNDGLALEVFLASAAAAFLLVAIHELGHAAAAKLVGCEVHGLVFTGAGGWCFFSRPASPLAHAFAAAGGLIAQAVALAVAICLVQLNGLPKSHLGTAILIVATAVNVGMMLLSAVPHGDSDGAQIASLLAQHRNSGSRKM